VLAIPRQQVLDLVSGSETDVKGINSGFLREPTSPNQLASQLCRLVGDRKGRDAAQCPQSAGTRGRVAHGSLVQNDLRDEQPIRSSGSSTIAGPVVDAPR
jgi:hypothetical protein